MANETTKTCKFEGTLKSAYTHTDKDDNGNVKGITNIISLFRDGLTVDGKPEVDKFFDAMYKDTVKKYIPDWHKEKKDYITVKSAYNIPVKLDEEGTQMSFAEFVERGNIRGAKVILKCNVKVNACYPSALLVLSEGEPYDAFKDF